MDVVVSVLFIKFIILVLDKAKVGLFGICLEVSRKKTKCYEHVF